MLGDYITCFCFPVCPVCLRQKFDVWSRWRRADFFFLFIRINRPKEDDEDEAVVKKKPSVHVLVITALIMLKRINSNLETNS